MWYFTWILGVLLALALGIINVMWYEAEQCMGATADDDDENRDFDRDNKANDAPGDPAGDIPGDPPGDHGDDAPRAS